MRNKFSLLLVCAGSCVLSLVILNAAVAAYVRCAKVYLLPLRERFRDDPGMNVVFDPEIGWVGRPGYASPSEHTNRMGFRSSQELDALPEGAQRVLVLGDSMAFGWGVNQRVLFTELLNRELPGYAFMNTAMIGYNTAQEYLLLRRCIAKVRPAVVMLWYCESNDMLQNVRADNYYPRVSLDARGDLVFRPALKENRVPWVARTALYRFIDSKFLSGKDVVYLRYRVDFALRGAQSYPWRLNRALLAEIAGLTRRNGARLIVIDIPTQRERHHTPLDARQRLLAQACREEGAAYYNLGDAYARDSDMLFLADRSHWNEAGHRFIADFVKKILAGK